MKDYPAHIRMDGDRRTDQSVAEHSRKTAEYAARDLETVGLSQAGYLTGLLHDLGKAKEEAARYLVDKIVFKLNRKRGSVNHTFAGCRFLLERYHPCAETGYAEIAAELFAYAVGAHHGLFDCIDEKQRSGFQRRLTQEGIGYEESVANFCSLCAGEAEVDGLFQQATDELIPVLDRMFKLASPDPVQGEGEFAFYLGLLVRLLLSAVIDGDRQDTAEFCLNRTVSNRLEGAELQEVWRECLTYVEQKLEQLPKDAPVQRARQVISGQCAAFAERRGGLYRLNVPTGGGKTLASLRYALAHAERYQKSRVIYTTSLLSVLDQNAAVIRAHIPNQRWVLEHHSDVVSPKDGEERIAWEQMTEQWSAPVIATTLVQLFNTLFSGEKNCIRRFQALCNSVIVIDEVQTVPNHLLTLFNLAVNFLAEICGATVVLCSATQPCLEAVAHPLYCVPAEMVPYQEDLWSAFHRTDIQDMGAFRLDEIPELARQALKEVDSLLVVCNQKEEAARLYRALVTPDIRCFHLSAAMCMAHRQAVLKQMEGELVEGGRKIVCISTQILEAGIDISFQRVFRLAAGMDSVVQAAGRCGRNGELKRRGKVCIIRCTDEYLGRLAEIRRGKQATIALLDAFGKAPERFDHDLSSAKAISWYYHELYRGMEDGGMDGYLPELDATMYDLLSANEKYAAGTGEEAGRFCLRQAFKAAGGAFRVFDDSTVSVLVPYRRGRELREQLIAMDQSGRSWAFDEIDQLVKEAKGYTVSLFQYQKERLEQLGGLKELFDGRICVMADGFYREDTGVQYG